MLYNKPQDNAYVYRLVFKQNLNFGIFLCLGINSRVKEHLVTRNPLTLIKEEANPCSRNNETMHMYKG